MTDQSMLALSRSIGDNVNSMRPIIDFVDKQIHFTFAWIISFTSRLIFCQNTKVKMEHITKESEKFIKGEICI